MQKNRTEITRIGEVMQLLDQAINNESLEEIVQAGNALAETLDSGPGRAHLSGGKKRQPKHSIGPNIPGSFGANDQ